MEIHSFPTFRALLPLVDFWEGNEGCGFLVSNGRGIIVDVWPTPSLRPAPDSYSIGRQAWIRARWRAREKGLRIVGSVHTHPNGPEGPSEKDLAIARRLRQGELRAVWHLRSGRLTVYDRSGILATQIVPRPWWFRLAARVLFE